MKNKRDSFQKRRIVLVGMPRSGKTSVGKICAKKLKVKFFDSDIELTKKFGSDIQELFEEFGETEFRKQESKVIYKILAHESFVLATGGGALENSKTKKLLNKEKFVVYLNVPAEEIALRIFLQKKNGKNFPKFLNLENFTLVKKAKTEILKQIAKEVYSLYLRREQNYKEVADFEISNTEIAEKTAKKILELFNSCYFK